MTPEDLIANLPPLGGVLREARAARLEGIEDPHPGTIRDADEVAALAVAKVVVEHVLRELEKRGPQSPIDFIPWSGGACPVGAHTRVDVRYRWQCAADDYTESGFAARDYWWGHTDSEDDIVAYRPRSEE